MMRCSRGKLILFASFVVFAPGASAQPAYKTVRIDLPRCAVRLPPVRDRDGHTVQNVRPMNPEYLCRALTALKNWIDSVPAGSQYVQRGDWARVVSVDIVRQRTISPTGDAPGFQIDLYADVPGRRNLLGLTFVENTGRTIPFTVHR
jgi:hypothetical protein